MKYKRKFMVPGNTINTCRNACPFRWDKRICYYYDQLPKGVPRNYYNPLKQDKNRCPIREKLDKPNEYVVSETEDGHWQCNCRGWIFKYKKLHQDCDHIVKAKSNPKKYEMAVEMTGTSVDTLKKILG